MSLFWRRHSKSISRRDALAAIPILHTNVRMEPLSGNTIVIKVNVNRGASFLDRFRPPVMEKRYELDAFGSFVVRQIDTQRTVLEIVRAFGKEFRMNHREAELGVVAFIKMLMQRSVLSVVAQSEKV